MAQRQPLGLFLPVPLICRESSLANARVAPESLKGKGVDEAAPDRGATQRDEMTFRRRPPGPPFQSC
jgi:hypothetical protein